MTTAAKIAKRERLHPEQSISPGPSAEPPAADKPSPVPCRATASWRGDAEEDLSQRWADVTDRSIHYMISRLTLGLSPAALLEAYFDWLIHLAVSPGKQVQLVEKGMRKWARLANYVATCARPTDDVARCIEPLPHDKRFAGEDWGRYPFNVIHQAFLLQQQWWHNATTGIRGVSKDHERQVEFTARQILDVFSPANFVLTNPEVLERTQAEAGLNLMRGAWNFLEDWERAANARPPVGAEAFSVGENLAITPGEVVLRNDLIELIQYAPTTPSVRPEPILIVPAWIMKYYILDLRPENSMVKYLVDQGFTVFMISWKNPGAEDRDLGLDDYRRMGVLSAIEKIREIVPETKVHGVGYCLGGTLLSIAAAALARNGDDPFKSLTLLAAEVDFKDAGELTLFTNESQVAFLEDMMWQQGYLDASQMAGAFQLLRSNDLVWSRIVHDYLMGDREPMFDLMAWNADATRMPARMHSEYLRKLFLRNELAEGRYEVDGKPAALTDIRAPVFGVATQTDHVAPWRSVYKLHLILDTDVTFVLTSGGHNAGIVSEPGRKNRSYRIATKTEKDLYLNPDDWVNGAASEDGSWWPAWTQWLAQHSGQRVAPPPMGDPASRLHPVTKAPGTYVLMK